MSKEYCKFCADELPSKESFCSATFTFDDDVRFEHHPVCKNCAEATAKISITKRPFTDKEKAALYCCMFDSVLQPERTKVYHYGALQLRGEKDYLEPYLSADIGADDEMWCIDIVLNHGEMIHHGERNVILFESDLQPGHYFCVFNCEAYNRCGSCDGTTKSVVYLQPFRDCDELDFCLRLLFDMNDAYKDKIYLFEELVKHLFSTFFNKINI